MVGDYVEFKHPAERTFADDDVVERLERLRDFLGRAIDDRLEHDALIDLIVAREHAPQRGARLRDSHFGQEAEAAKIYAQDRSALRRDHPRDAEQRAVATEHNYQVGTIGEVVPLDAFGADFLGSLGICNRGLVLGAKKTGECSRDGDGFGPLALDDQADRLY